MSKRYSDVQKAGPSGLVPYVYAKQSRHCRRLETALRFRDELAWWCYHHGLKLSIYNEGHHWKLEKPGFVAEWWPSSAKLIFDKKWDAGIHVHDIEQLATLVEKRLGA